MFDTSVLDEALAETRRQLDAERQDILQTVRRALQGIRGKYSINEAYVIGSLLNPRGWHRTSDVDVAVGGCSIHVLDVMRELEDATDREVDIVDLDRHPSPQSFTARGLKIYG